MQLLCLPKISGSCGYSPHTLTTINFTDLISVKSNNNLINLKISTMIHSLKILNALGGEYKAKQNRCCELGVLPSYIVGAFENTRISKS